MTYPKLLIAGAALFTFSAFAADDVYHFDHKYEADLLITSEHKSCQEMIDSTQKHAHDLAFIRVETSLTLEQISTLTEVLQTASSLKKIVFDTTGLTDDGAKKIPALLATLLSFNKIQLIWSNIGDDGLKALVEVLKQKPEDTPITLDLRGNKITTKGVFYLKDALYDCNHLTLTLVNNHLIDEDGDKILTLGKKVRTIEDME